VYLCVFVFVYVFALVLFRVFFKDYGQFFFVCVLCACLFVCFCSMCASLCVFVCYCGFSLVCLCVCVFVLEVFVDTSFSSNASAGETPKVRCFFLLFFPSLIF